MALKRRKWSRSFARIAPVSILGPHLSSFVFIIMAFAALIFSSWNPARVSTLRAIAVDAASPVLFTLNKPFQDAAELVHSFYGYAHMREEIAALREENVKLHEWYETALLSQAENRSLRDLLNVRIDPRSTFITGRIIADTGSQFAKTVLVNAGANDGVKKGQAVLSSEGVIGRIVEVGDQSARVLLVTDINSRVPVLVEDTRHHGVLAGQNESMPVLKHLVDAHDIPLGARVVTSGYGGMFPMGLPVGQVVTTGGQVQVRMFADFNRIVHVRVVDNPLDAQLYLRAEPAE